MVYGIYYVVHRTKKHIRILRCGSTAPDKEKFQQAWFVGSFCLCGLLGPLQLLFRDLWSSVGSFASGSSVVLVPSAASRYGDDVGRCKTDHIREPMFTQFFPHVLTNLDI